MHPIRSFNNLGAETVGPRIMATKIRIFISSTMADLANERQAVVERARELLAEPVNAEALLPNGATSWDLLADEIRNSDIFVLLLGERYGWIPKTGYGAELNKSVTHLEADVARAANIPIWPFVKRLKYGADSTSDDAIRRDLFRLEIGDWAKGKFYAEFDLALDLGKKVHETLLNAYTDSFLKGAIRAARGSRPQATEPVKLPVIPSSVRRSLPLGAVLFAGSGLSTAAGYPSANTIAEVLRNRLGVGSSDYQIHDLALLAKETIGNAGLMQILMDLLDPPFDVKPTLAHLAAVREFPIIITTNYDLLFEHACAQSYLDCITQTPSSLNPGRKAAVTIYKTRGSISEPSSLDFAYADAHRVQGENKFWSVVQRLLQERPVVVAGQSMADEISHMLLTGRNRNLPGLYVSPSLSDAEIVLLRRHRLEGIKCNLDEYLGVSVADKTQ